MSQQWYYARGSQQFGPVTMDQLQGLLGAGQVQHADLVWTQGMAQWATAQTVPELANAAMPIAQGAGVNVPYPRAVGSASADIGAPTPVMAAAVAENHGWESAPNAAAQPPLGNPTWAAPGVSPGVLGYQAPMGMEQYYGGFWMRFAAFIIDAIVTGIVGQILRTIVLAAAGAGAASPGSPSFLPVLGLLQAISLVTGWLYYAVMESSVNQGTLGKMAVGLRVTDLDGRPIGFGRASGRYFGKLLSALILGIGYLMAGWTERKQALHDIMAGTLVIKKTP